MTLRAKPRLADLTFLLYIVTAGRAVRQLLTNGTTFYVCAGDIYTGGQYASRRCIEARPDQPRFNPSCQKVSS